MATLMRRTFALFIPPGNVSQQLIMDGVTVVATLTNNATGFSKTTLNSGGYDPVFNAIKVAAGATFGKWGKSYDDVNTQAVIVITVDSTWDGITFNTANGDIVAAKMIEEAPPIPPLSASAARSSALSSALLARV